MPLVLLAGCETLGIEEGKLHRVHIDFQCDSGAQMQLELNQDERAGSETVTINPPIGKQ